MSSGHDDYAVEPVPGLPERLPEGETLLWQGVPDWRALARRVFRVRLLVGYFALLVAWRVGDALAGGEGLAAAGASALSSALLGAAAVGLLVLLARASARSTVYSITDRRVVMRFGIAIPMTVNLPFKAVDAAAVKAQADGSGDITLTLSKGARVGYFTMWPHARPWRVARAEPMLRGLPRVGEAAEILGHALAAAAGQAAQPMPSTASASDASPGARVSRPLAGAAA